MVKLYSDFTSPCPRFLVIIGIRDQMHLKVASNAMATTISIRVKPLVVFFIASS